MPFNQGQGVPLRGIIANLDELEGFNPVMAEAIRQQEERQIALLNEILRDMPPEEIIQRLKSLLWRLAPLLRLSEMIQLDYGGEVLSHSLRSALSGMLDAVKWIGWKHGVDPMAAFGDDTVIVDLRDMTLGQQPTSNPHETQESGLDATAKTGENVGDDDI